MGQTPRLCGGNLPLTNLGSLVTVWGVFWAGTGRTGCLQKERSQVEQKAWGGRFSQPTDALVEQFTASILFDRRLYAYDIQGSIAHCRMLAKCGIIGAAEADAIAQGLQKVQAEIEAGEFSFDVHWEDIHMHIERRLIELVGPVGGKLHTARSRNDQIVTDMRLWMRARVVNLARLSLGLLHALTEVAWLHLDSVMAGYTHHQHATISTFGHHLAAYAEAIRRVVQRLHFWYETFNYSPLGCVTGFEPATYGATVRRSAS